MGKPAELSDKIITRRLNILLSVPNFTGSEYTLADIGCGNGASTILLAPKMKFCTGVEVFEEHKLVFDRIKSEAGVTNAEFMLYNIEQKPLSEKVDRLISFEVIEHLENENSVVNYLQSLKPGGVAAITVPNKWWIFETHGAHLPLLPWNRVPFFSWLPRPLHERWANARIYTKRRIRKLLEKSGFVVDDIKYVTAPMDVLKDGRLKRFLTRTLFKNDTTKNPFLAVSVFVVAHRPEE